MKMKNAKKQILSLLLCATLLCGFAPVGSASASGGTVGNSTLCEQHRFGAWTINENSGFERKCAVCGAGETSEEPDFMASLTSLETADDIAAELNRLYDEKIIDLACYEALSSVFSGRAARLSAEGKIMATKQATVTYTGLPASGVIDIASAPDEGISLTLKITASMTKDEWIEHIKTPALKERDATNCGWQPGGWDKFSFTLSPSVFAQSGLVVDWANVSLTNAFNFYYYNMTSNDSGIIIKGENTGTVSANSVMASYRNWDIKLTIPVTLPKSAYETVCQKGGIKLGEGITLSSEGVDDLYFPISNTVEVLDSRKGRLVVTGDGATYENRQWKLHDGNYTISGTAYDFESVVIAGNAAVTLDNVNISLKNSEKTDILYVDAPAISIESGSVELKLVGNNTVEGSRGRAGIYVAEGAALTIQGEGSITAKGGDYASVASEKVPGGMVEGNHGDLIRPGAAGIGGNAIYYTYVNRVYTCYENANFGKITIESGTVTAAGGETGGDFGAGAGIGSGGGNIEACSDTLQGEITINGGKVTATGGKGINANYNWGGAGIGAGAQNQSNVYVSLGNDIRIMITGGEVTAQACPGFAGAGIGSGANVHTSGKIFITGGTVTAVGAAHERFSSNGGAGIGAGDMGSAKLIEISGGTITATGGGAAAGIGGGCGENYIDNGYCGTINISGNANIIATGGSEGGPGIGPGKQLVFESIAQDEVSKYKNEINISGGTIKAVGGNNGAGIGGTSHQTVVINIRGGEIEAAGGNNGAGIGGGNNYSYHGVNDQNFGEVRCTGLVEINISNGRVKASGGNHASGIGAGAYGRAANVSISGGYVEATGGCDANNKYGAAGIGSGYWSAYYQDKLFPDEVFEINITGGTVIAKTSGIYSGAGIGLGFYDNEPVKINISGGDVWAYGGGRASGIGCSYSYKDNSVGRIEIAITGGNVVATGGQYASGIGSGQKGGAVDISITGDAKVKAYGQTYAYAIGKSYETVGDVALTLSDTITLWAQNGNTVNLAIPANTKYIKQSKNGSIYLATYTNEKTTNLENVAPNAANKASGRLTDDVATDENAVLLDWTYKAPQYVILNESVVIDTLLNQAAIPGNWATLYSTPKITVSYAWTSVKNPTDVTAPADDMIETGTQYTAKAQDASMQGYRFNGWYTDEECTQAYQDGSTLNNDTTLYGKWDKLYDVSYDPNGGSGTMIDSNSPYVQGAFVTIMENAFVRPNYDFTGWNTARDGSGESYSAGDNYPIEDDITLYAQWEKKAEVTIPQTGDDTNVFLWMVLLVVSCGGLAGTLAFRKRRTMR